MKNSRLSTLLPLLLLAALLFSGSPAAAQNELPASGPLKAEAAQNLIAALGKNLTILDVRSPANSRRAMCPALSCCPWNSFPPSSAQSRPTNPCSLSPYRPPGKPCLCVGPPGPPAADAALVS